MNELRCVVLKLYISSYGRNAPLLTRAVGAYIDSATTSLYAVAFTHVVRRLARSGRPACTNVSPIATLRPLGWRNGGESLVGPKCRDSQVIYKSPFFVPTRSTRADAESSIDHSTHHKERRHSIRLRSCNAAVGGIARLAVHVRSSDGCCAWRSQYVRAAVHDAPATRQPRPHPASTGWLGLSYTPGGGCRARSSARRRR